MDELARRRRRKNKKDEKSNKIKGLRINGHTIKDDGMDGQRNLENKIQMGFFSRKDIHSNNRQHTLESFPVHYYDGNGTVTISFLFCLHSSGIRAETSLFQAG